jgi:Tfp pilus assembly protein PilX
MKVRSNLEIGKRAQRGAVLAVALALLTTFTLLALAAGQSIRGHARTLSSLSERQEVFEQAEMALRQGEMQAAALRETPSGADVILPARLNWTNTVIDEVTWWRGHGSRVSSRAQAGHPAYYVVEKYGQTASEDLFRVTAASIYPGAPGVVLQSIFAVARSDEANQGMECEARGTACDETNQGRQSWLQLR